MAKISTKSFQASFFKRHPLAESVAELFKALPQTYFFAKDRESRFVNVNQPFAEIHGMEHESQMIGKTDRDFHPHLMAEAYISEDQRVMDSRQALTGQVWLVLYQQSVPRWYISSKTPLFSAEGEVIGIAGAMYHIEQPEELMQHFKELLPVVNYIEQHFADNISMAEMAKMIGLSSTHFNRRFRELIRMTPMQYLRTVRIHAAQRMLVETSKTLVEIAVDVGYTDQSHLTKRFRAVTGMTPADYRKRFIK